MRIKEEKRKRKCQNETCGKMYTPRKKTQKYCCKECREEVKARKAKLKRTHKTCKWCGKFKHLDEFPRSSYRYKNKRRGAVCRYCMPWTMEHGRYLPECVKYVETNNEIKEERCPLYDNCRERKGLGFDPACFAPDRRVLIGFILLSAAEKKRARELFKVRLVGGKVEKDSIDNYLNYYMRGSE